MTHGINTEQSLADLEEQIGGSAHPAYILASQLPKLHGESRAEMEQVLTKTWNDDGDKWTVQLNGSGKDWYPVVSPFAEDMPDPCKVEVYAGAHLVKVDGEALAIIHPGHVEYFTPQSQTKIWGRAILGALRDRLVELGLDLPPVDDLVRDVDE